MNLSILQRLAATLLLTGGAYTVVFADDYTDFVRQTQAEYAQFRDSALIDYAAFRQKSLAEYAEFMTRTWTLTHVDSVIQHMPDTVPEPEPAPPAPTPAPPVVIDTIVVPPIVPPAPEPVIPPDDTPAYCVIYRVPFYGSEVSVTGPDFKYLRIHGTAEADFASALKELYLLSSCDMLTGLLAARDEMILCDWAYVRLVSAFAGEVYPDSRFANERALLTGYLLNQSGYMIRFALSGTRLMVLFATDGTIYGRPYYTLSGVRFFPVDDVAPGSIKICDFAYPGEQKVYLGLRKAMNLPYSAGRKRTVELHGHPGTTLTFTPNANLIDFYNDFPDCSATYGSDTKWIMYGTAAASPEFRQQLYPVLRIMLKGMSQRDGVALLLALAQSFAYGSDQEIWGRDRAFFPDETWAYDLSDCEDHAIHFARLVRDLLGLDVALVLYPNHLAAAVHFTDGSITGDDYIISRGTRWSICDPTYFYAAPGRSMADQPLDRAKLLLLPR